MKLLNGKVAIVTGSSSGIGKGIATAFALNGALVVVTSRTFETAKKVTEEITTQGGKAFPCSFDVDDPQSGKTLLKTVHKEFKQIDILVNNAISRSSIAPCLFQKIILCS